MAAMILLLGDELRRSRCVVLCGTVTMYGTSILAAAPVFVVAFRSVTEPMPMAVVQGSAGVTLSAGSASLNLAPKTMFTEVSLIHVSPSVTALAPLGRSLRQDPPLVVCPTFDYARWAIRLTATAFATAPKLKLHSSPFATYIPFLISSTLLQGIAMKEMSRMMSCPMVMPITG